MEKNTGKIIAICGLVVAVIALAVGFAAYSATLTISSFDVKVGDDTFSPNVNYRAESMSCTPGGNATVTSAGTVSGTTWSGIQASFKGPGDSITCTATVENTSSFIGYLKSLTTASPLVCAADDSNSNPATIGVSDACTGMTLDVTVGSATMQATSAAAGSNTSITGNTIAATTGTQTVTLVLTYATGSAVADGDFKVTVPQINLLYKTTDS